MDDYLVSVFAALHAAFSRFGGGTFWAEVTVSLSSSNQSFSSIEGYYIYFSDSKRGPTLCFSPPFNLLKSDAQKQSCQFAI